MPVLPLVGSSSSRPGSQLAGGFRGLDHRLRDAVLDRAGRVLPFELRGEFDVALGLSSTSGVLPTRSSSDAATRGLTATGHRRQEDDSVARGDRCFEAVARADVLAADVDVRILEFAVERRGNAPSGRRAGRARCRPPRSLRAHRRCPLGNAVDADDAHRGRAEPAQSMYAVTVGCSPQTGQSGSRRSVTSVKVARARRRAAAARRVARRSRPGA